MPAEVAKPCEPAIIKRKEDVRAWAARWKAAYKTCSAIHDDAVRWSEQVRLRFGAK